MNILDRFRLDGKVAVVTGGGRGIGRGIALAFAEAGADVAVGARRKHEVDSVAEEIQAIGKKAFPMKIDVLKKEDIENFAKETAKELGDISIWINNAGGNIDRTPRHLVDTPEEVWDTLIALNLTSCWNGARAAVKHMDKRGGSIVNIVSAAAWGAAPTFGPYAAGKSGTISITKTLAIELSEQRIRVNCVAPGLIPTEMLMETMKVDENAVEKMGAGIAAGRVGTPEDIATACIYLCSEAGTWVTGQTIWVTGGPLPSTSTLSRLRRERGDN